MFGWGVGWVVGVCGPKAPGEPGAWKRFVHFPRLPPRPSPPPPLSSYPVELAEKLPAMYLRGGVAEDAQPGDPLQLLHEPFNTMHLVASFSGCVVLQGSQEFCNELFTRFARYAEASWTAEARM